MPNQKKKTKLAKHGDKLDKYREHLFERADLNPTELEMLEKYRKAWSLMGIGYSREQAVTVLRNDYGLSLPQCYVIVREAIQLYGDVMETNKKGMRQIMYENFMLAANLARKAGDFNSMIRATENAAKLQDAFNPDQDLQDPTEFLKPVTIIFTSDPKVLKENQQQRQLPSQNTEDTDYEEYDED